jgi:isoquinoline 1-oxidoreductase beta subunit
MTDAPGQIETVIIESGEAMGGVGEPPLPPLAPAVVNALVALTGQPIRELPLSRHRFA